MYERTTGEPANPQFVRLAEIAKQNQSADYQLWQHRGSGERFAVKLSEYVPAEQRGIVAGSLADQQYEVGLILGVAGPLYCGSGHQPMTVEGLKTASYSAENVGWLREHSAEFFRVEFLPMGPTGKGACILCGLQHEPAEAVQMSVAQVLDLIRQRRPDALEMADWCKLNWPDDPPTAKGWLGRAQELKELLEAIPGTPEAAGVGPADGAGRGEGVGRLTYPFRQRVRRSADPPNSDRG